MTRTSTIVIKRVTYTVPSRLIQSRLLIRVYDNRLTLFLDHEQVLELEGVYSTRNSRARSVNYQHVIDALVKKPRSLSYVTICFPTTITKPSGSMLMRFYR